MRKMSEICIFLSVFIAFVTTGYLWFTGQKDEALFTSTWIPSILTFAIYAELINRKDQTMPDIAIFFLGLGCFILAIVGVLLGRNASAQEKHSK